jgi:glucose/arabinose dehydrogenase
MRFEPAQSLETTLGKIVRINADGSIPPDNPFVGEANAREEIWSCGHRNLLSAAIEPLSGILWVVEMGPLGGDEINRVLPGENYGWPLVSDGDHYVRATAPEAIAAIPGHASAPEKFMGPVRSWSPVISPSGATFYEGEMFPV